MRKLFHEEYVNLVRLENPKVDAEQNISAKEHVLLPFPTRRLAYSEKGSLERILTDRSGQSIIRPSNSE